MILTCWSAELKLKINKMKLESKDLRIGNFVKRNSDVIIAEIITDQSCRGAIINPKNGFYYGSIPFGLCDGVKLTVQYLIDFDFNKTKPLLGSVSAYRKKMIRLDVSNSGNIYYNMMPIYHVHQLQNLYFSIMLEELVIKQK
jgi:hypothetical protein